MTAPRIFISRHQPGFYEWTLTVGQEALDNEVGEPSISSCLSSAVRGLPEDIRLVEVVYRGIHMGTFVRLALEHAGEDIAERIASAHGALTHNSLTTKI